MQEYNPNDTNACTLGKVSKMYRLISPPRFYYNTLGADKNSTTVTFEKVITVVALLTIQTKYRGDFFLVVLFKTNAKVCG